MCNYRCPFADRKPCAGFLLCRDLYQDGVNYNVRENAMTVICAFQKQCMKTGRMENTDSARECYRMRCQVKQAAPAEPPADAAPADPVPAEVTAEEAPAEKPAAPKTTRSRKKN